MFALIALLLCLLSPALANFKLFLSKDTYSASSSESLTVEWVDDGFDPDTGQFVAASFLLCTHNATGFTCPITLGKNIPLNVDQTSQSFPLNKIRDEYGSGMFVVQMVALKNVVAYVINYSEYATITGMTGSGIANQGPVPYGDVSGFGSTESLTWSSYSVPPSIAALPSDSVPYTWQLGPTRMAPMQPTPGTKVTVPLSATRRNPTSSYSVYKTYLKTQLPFTTLTPSPSKDASQYPNFAETVPVSLSGRIPQKVTPTPMDKRKRRRWSD